MKQKIIVSIVIVVIIIGLTLFFMESDNSTNQEMRYAPERPDDTNLEFWITENVPSIRYMGYEEIGHGFGVTTYLGKGYEAVTEVENLNLPPEYYVLYSVTAYPDYADGGQYVTTIEITDPNINVYGLTVNSTFEEFDRVFEEMGYEIDVREESHYVGHTAKKDGITFTLDYGEQFPPTLTIRAEVTNREGIMF